MCSCRGRGQGERWMQPARPRGSCIQGDAPWHVPPLPCCCGAEILLWHGRRGSDHVLLSPRPRCHPVPEDRAGTESCGCGCAAPPSTPRSAGGGSAEKRSWKWEKKKTVRSARLSCARRIPFSPPIFPRNGSKLHEAPLPSGSGGGCAGRRPAPCSDRAQPLLTPLLAEPPQGSSCALLCPQPFWMHLHLPWHHRAVHEDVVLV